MTRLLLVLALCAFLAEVATARPVDGVAAIVDGRVITRSEVEDFQTTPSQLAARQARPVDPRSEALEALIELSLVQKEAERLGIRVADEEAEKAISDIRARNSMDSETFLNALAAQGVDYPRYKEDIRTQILRAKVAGQVLRSRLAISDEALREYYLKHVADFCQPGQVRLRHLEVSRDRSQAEAIRSKMLSGQEAVAPDSGRDMGFLSFENLSETVKEAVRGLPVGGVSPVLEIGGSCHLFIVEEEKRGRVPAYEEVADVVKERYFEDREDELYRTWIDSLKQRARIERR